MTERPDVAPASGAGETAPVPDAAVVEPEAEVFEAEVIEAEVIDPGDTGDDATDGPDVDLIGAELTAAQAEIDEYRDTLQRLKADFDNYKKRVVREQTALIERASAELIREMLPVLDAFEAALSVPLESTTVEQLHQGLEKVWEQLTTVLAGAGVDRIASVEVPFDPELHEAVMTSEGEGGPVVEGVLRSGWALKGRVLRPAMVRVRG